MPPALPRLQKYRLYLKRLAGLPANAPLSADTLQQVGRAAGPPAHLLARAWTRAPCLLCLRMAFLLLAPCPPSLPPYLTPSHS
jgi:hypothetical protein